MNKYIFLTLTALACIPLPSQALWVASQDEIRENDFSDWDDERGHSVRTITLDFSRRRPTYGNAKYRSMNEAEAKDEVERLWREANADAVEIDFDSVRLPQHLKILKDALNPIDFQGTSVSVSFTDTATFGLQQDWDAFHKAKQAVAERRMEAKAERERRRNQRFEDFTDSGTFEEAYILDEDGYFDSDDDY